ncbi:MAG: DUF721 domain-containing protein [Spirochaetales bacterium]|nr:DUF721 domain-containing protein [Candidatus Physcosoma equi]
MNEKTIWDGVMEYFQEAKIDVNRHRFYEAWPIVAGFQLSSCTQLMKVRPEEGKIYVKANSLSARSLLMMERKRILVDWNKMFPDAEIKEVVVSKRG